jgi:hypothetical protein
MPDGFPKGFHLPTDEIYSICFSASVHVRVPRSEFSGMVGSSVVCRRRGTPSPRNTKGFRNHDGSSTPDTDDEYAFDFTLSPASTRPQVTADRAQDFGCQWVSVLGLRELMLGGVLAWSSIVETIIARGASAHDRTLPAPARVGSPCLWAALALAIMGERSSCPNWTETRSPSSPRA